MIEKFTSICYNRPRLEVFVYSCEMDRDFQTWYDKIIRIACSPVQAAWRSREWEHCV